MGSTPPDEPGAISLLGVRLRIHVSWILMAVLIAWSLASGSLPLMFEGLPKGAYWLMAAVIVVGLAVSIVLHELAHTLVGRALGVQVDRITLFLFGGVAELREEPKRPTAELWMALAGPAFSVLFGILLGAASGAMQAAGGSRELARALSYLAALNLVLAAFNMAPAFPLDGGRVLRAIIWSVTGDLARATRIAARTGEILALILIGLGVVALFTRGAAAGLWWILIGLFLHAAARGARLDAAARQTLGGHAIAEVMASDVKTVPADFTLDQFVEERLMRSRHGLYPVVDGEQWLGAVAPEDILRTPRVLWGSRTVGKICTPAASTPTANLLEDVAGVMDRMRRLGVQRMPVVHGGAVVGMVILQDLLGSVELWRRFRPSGVG